MWRDDRDHGQEKPKLFLIAKNFRPLFLRLEKILAGKIPGQKKIWAVLSYSEKIPAPLWLQQKFFRPKNSRAVLFLAGRLRSSEPGYIKYLNIVGRSRTCCVRTDPYVLQYHLVRARITGIFPPSAPSGKTHEKPQTITHFRIFFDNFPAVTGPRTLFFHAGLLGSRNRLHTAPGFIPPGYP